ncbi:MAG: thioredoxin fold domain-containing protein [Ferruginibacter sp.]
MKSFYLFLFLTGTFLSSFAQQDSLPVYRRFPTVPPFKLVNVKDSSIFKKEDLPRKKEVLIMIFSPDCEHCQVATKDMLANIDAFKKVQIVMASSLDYTLVKTFYEVFELYKFPNIIVTRDPSYFLGTFFNVHNFPSIFTYDKKGNLVNAWEGSVSFKKISKDF